jgi:hypothetical protein
MYPVDAITVKDPFAVPVGVPVIRPVVERVRPPGIVVLVKEITDRPERVDAVSWIGVMARFWIKDNCVAVGWLNVMTSFRMARLMSRNAVAGVPTALAVTRTRLRAVTVSGMPERSTTLDALGTKARPVPVRSVVLNVTGNPEAADALNWTEAG